MKKSKKFAALFSAAALTFSAIGVTPVAAESDDSRTIEQMLSEMTTEQKVEQMIMLSIRSWSEGSGMEAKDVTSLNDEQRALIEEHNFGGICLYAPNIQNIAQTVALTTDIQDAALKSECAIPMLISTDQEGGRIYRLGTGTPTCGNMAIGAAADPELAEENAKILGREVKALGINTNLAPVLDVNNNPANPVINLRSFSSDPELVSQMGVQYIKGLQSEGVITTCKHFPGHGDTATSSQTGLPLIDKSYDELKKTELLPYIDAINAGADMIMTAHIQFPQIETDTYTSIEGGEQITLPSSLSDTIITDILRGDYKFDGVITTDSLLMGAIQQNFDVLDASELAINADVDIILDPISIQSSEDIDKMEDFIDKLVKKVDDGEISEETIDKSVTRILKMKEKRGVLDYTAPNLEEAFKIVGSAENREKALEIAEKTVTLVKNEDDLLPLKLGENGKVAYFYPYENVENTMHFTLDRLKKEGIIAEGVTADCIWHRYHNAEEFEENIKNSDAVIISFEMYNSGNTDKTATGGWQAQFTDDLIELAHKNGKKVIFISSQMPYDIGRFTDVDAAIISYCANPMDELPSDDKENPAYGVNYPAALITIFGGNSPVGRLPIDIYEIDKEKNVYTDKILYPYGFGLNYSTEPETTTAETTTISESTSAETETTTVTTTAKPSSKKTETVKNSPKTGSRFPSFAVLSLAVFGTAAVISRKKND